jgi:hypothetical protein
LYRYAASQHRDLATFHKSAAAMNAKASIE